MSTTASEKQLVLECQNGNKNSFEGLYNLYIQKIYTFIYYKTLHQQTAEDLTSITFFKALRSIQTCNVEKPFSAWIYQIARNTVIDYFRSSTTAQNIDDFWDISDKTNVASDVANKMQIDVVKKHLQKLSSEQRDIVMMRLWQGLPYKEISLIIGKNENNCKVIFSRAIKSLKNDLGAAIILILFNIWIP